MVLHGGNSCCRSSHLTCHQRRAHRQPADVPDAAGRAGRPARAALAATLRSTPDPIRPEASDGIAAATSFIAAAILSIWLVRPANKPESVVVMWPQRPTAVSPRHYSELAATVCRLVANASTELAAIKAGRRT